MGAKQRAEVTENFAATADLPRVIVATSSYIGEGFDYSRLDILFLAMPISWRGTLTICSPPAPSPRQQTGRGGLRLRRLQCSHARANVREAPSRVQSPRMLHSAGRDSSFGCGTIGANPASCRIKTVSKPHLLSPWKLLV